MKPIDDIFVPLIASVTCRPYDRYLDISKFT